ncbi:MAG: phage terminase large subunit [Chloroflexota bacterium]|nr:phage terminase large subunit [Chloroflexota bacterium]
MTETTNPAEWTRTNHPNPVRVPLHRERKYRPTDRQREIHDLLMDESGPSLTLVGYGGAMGGGKTRAIVELAIDAALMHPGNNVLVARQHYTDLSTTTMKEFFRVCPERYIRRRQLTPTPLVEVAEVEASWDKISTINFRHLTDWSGLGSQEYGAVLIDEAGEVDEEAAQMLLTRLRHPAQPQRWFVAASNPWPGWFERWFARRELDEDAFREADGRLVYIPARIPDNPHLPERYAEQQRALQPGEWVNRFIEGRFDAFDGQIYSDFDPQRHLWDAPLPSFARYVGGLDFGGQSPRDHYTAGVVAGITDRSAPCGANVLIRLGEFEDRGPGVTERLEIWQRHWKRKLGRIRWCADRSQLAWIDHQKRQGLRVVPSKGGSGSVNWGISLVQQRLSADPPSSYYTPSMGRFPERMREYQWARTSGKSGGPGPKPRKQDDDLLDADRYMHELAERKRSTGPRRIVFDLPPGQPRLTRWPAR